jgi:hypothetical protein
MTREGLEEVRRRLLGDQQVQQMIRDRAFEIYELRGGQPGGAAQDWLRAEREVLAFLIARESTRAKEKSPEAAAAPVKRRSRRASQPKKESTKRPASKKPSASKGKSKRSRKPPAADESE